MLSFEVVFTFVEPCEKGAKLLRVWVKDLHKRALAGSTQVPSCAGGLLMHTEAWRRLCKVAKKGARFRGHFRPP